MDDVQKRNKRYTDASTKASQSRKRMLAANGLPSSKKRRTKLKDRPVKDSAY